jgi:CPA2 family monovalent cation:H+ antiporter-2
MHDTLTTILVLLATAVAVVVICRVLRLSPILGYLVVGIAIGPHALGWIPDAPQTRYLAEFGIVFLMFSIGLEFSLPQLKAMRRKLLGIGLCQVAITIAGTALFMQLHGDGWVSGIALGGALAMSSTAIVSKILTERAEVTTAHGREAMGVLLFQDLAVVPLLIVVPALAVGSGSLGQSLGIAAIKAAIVLAFILILGQWVMRYWFHLVARLRSSELFMLNLLLFTLGLAALTELAGLSLALGAFLAGMLIAETEFRYQVEEDIKPFRDVLLGLFFVTVGMRLDLAIVLRHWALVLLLLTVPVLLKAVLVAALSRLFGASLSTALRSGIYLAQAGEFGFVLVAQADQFRLLSPDMMQVILAAMLLSMLSAPFLIQFAEPLVRKLTANDWLARAAELTQIAARTMTRQDHVIICGYGRSGQNLARLLDREGIGYLALDSDPQRVREAAADGNTVVYGDATRKEALQAAGLARARAVAVTFADTSAAMKILHHVRALRPDLPVVVRTVDDSELERLNSAGATEVVPEVLEGSLMLASHSLLLLGVPLNRVLKLIRSVREERYGLFRGFFHGATDQTDAAENVQPRLHSVLITEQAAALGKTVLELEIARWVEVTGVRKQGARARKPDPEEPLAAGDVLVLLGRPEQLARAEQRLLEGKGG